MGNMSTARLFDASLFQRVCYEPLLSLVSAIS